MTWFGYVWLLLIVLMSLAKINMVGKRSPIVTKGGALFSIITGFLLFLGAATVGVTR
jgi:hypothetical protein